MERQFGSSSEERTRFGIGRNWSLVLPTPLTACDVLAIVTVTSLPWSTTIASVFGSLWVLSTLPLLRFGLYLNAIVRSRSGFALALFALALVGSLWAFEVPWAARLRGVNPTLKLVAIPFLTYHFQRSSRSDWIPIAFLLSCTVLLVLSWITTVEPTFALKPNAVPGVPVKNYIDQSQSFALCAIVLAWPILESFKSQKSVFALLLLAISGAFLANLAFVVLARSALVYIPIMLVLFSIFYLPRKFLYHAIVGGALLIASLWFASTNLQDRTRSISLEYSKFSVGHDITSVGLRLEYWRKSFSFLLEAPVFGHGTGSVQMLFDQAAKAQTGLAAETISNPHNQILNVAVQWGMVGCTVLVAMWISHLLLFRGPGFYSWLGSIAVVQNIVSSMFNSHLFDFVPGWIYVISVSLSAGMMLRRETQ
ncbi:O-antigen ligase [Bradyrhizobium liaoningense]|uniref:O-antigen ligase family protein n=1 Tax=Bradyrhizobium liaoningense TaxID=43992 RepID=UPI001BADACE3|nr:O-antigen ligase family protein [Bradyrhizobium liaoningense]MBR0904607.1 O-antigen ligase family protein [Bradyrhizobium liaoningense]